MANGVFGGEFSRSPESRLQVVCLEGPGEGRVEVDPAAQGIATFERGTSDRQAEERVEVDPAAQGIATSG